MLKLKISSYLLVACMLAISGCAHKTRVVPSNGHINSGNVTPAAQPTAVNAAANTATIPKLVKPQVNLPPPKASKKAQTYSVVVNEVPVKEILFALARESKINVDIHPAIQGRATLNAVDQTLPAILERLAKQVDLTYKMDGNTLNITPDLPVLRTYKVDYVNMNRDTKGFIGAAAEISSTGQSASTGNGGQTVSTTSFNAGQKLGVERDGALFTDTSPSIAYARVICTRDRPLMMLLDEIEGNETRVGYTF